MWRIRRLIYKVGLRPKWPSIFFSPALNVIYVIRNTKPEELP